MTRTPLPVRKLDLLRAIAVLAVLWIAIIAADFLLGYAAWTIWFETWFVRAAFCAVLGVTLRFVADLASSRVTRIAHTLATYSYGSPRREAGDPHRATHHAPARDAGGGGGGTLARYGGPRRTIPAACSRCA
ncbi:MAG: hypothetical protein ABI446_10350 [Gemmatimonadaceae bacterium]